MTYHTRGLGQSTPPIVSAGPTGGGRIDASAAIAAQWSQAVKPRVPTGVTMSGGAAATVAQISAQLPAAYAAVQAACASFTDPVAHLHCEEAAQVLSGPDLARNVQAKLDCDDLILNQGVLTDDQRIDCVDCAYNRGVPKDRLAAAVLQLEVDRAYAAGLSQQKFFAKHKVAIFAVGGGALALGLAAVILRRKHTAQPNRRARTRRSR